MKKTAKKPTKRNKKAEGYIELKISPAFTDAEIKSAITFTADVLKKVAQDFDELFPLDVPIKKIENKTVKADKPCKKIECKKPVKAVKPCKKPCCGGLTKAEQAKVRALRKTGMPIKAIAKEIHRRDKAVAAFVHSFEKTAKK